MMILTLHPQMATLHEGLPETQRAPKWYLEKIGGLNF